MQDLSVCITHDHKQEDCLMQKKGGEEGEKEEIAKSKY